MSYTKIQIKISPTDKQKEIITNTIDLSKKTYAILLTQGLKDANNNQNNTLTKETLIKLKEVMPRKGNEDISVFKFEYTHAKICIKKILSKSHTLEELTKQYMNEESYTIYNINKKVDITNEYITLPKIGNIKITDNSFKYEYQKIKEIKIINNSGIYTAKIKCITIDNLNTILSNIDKTKPNFINTYNKITTTLNKENLEKLKTNKKYSELLKLKTLHNLLSLKQTYSKKWYITLSKIKRSSIKIINSPYSYT